MSTIEDSEEPISALPVAMDPFGEGSELRTRNASDDDWERRNVIERTQNSVHIHCDLMDVRHGFMGSVEDGGRATLIVLRFRFDPQKNSRRIKHATVRIEFVSSNPRDEPPEVYTVAPEQRWNLAATNDHEQNVSSGDLSLSASGVPFLTAGGALKMERTTTRDISAATTVTGTTQLGTGRNSGMQTVASWRLIENNKRSSGVPDSVRVAMLLKRETDDPFKAMVTIEADADLATSLGSLFARVPLDDPVLFNPTAEPDRPIRGRSYGVENLEELSLYSLCDARIAGRRYEYVDVDDIE